MVEKSRQFDRRCFMIRTGKVNYFFISGRRECAFFYLMTDCSLSLRRVKSTFKRNTEEKGAGYISSALRERSCDKIKSFE